MSIMHSVRAKANPKLRDLPMRLRKRLYCAGCDRYVKTVRRDRANRLTVWCAKCLEGF